MSDSVLTLSEAMHANIQDCERRFARSVRPLYLSLNGSSTEAVGSCVLLRVTGSNYVVTAAHVIDLIGDAEEHSLHVAGWGTELVQILGSIQTTNDRGDRDSDHMDFAFWEVQKSTEARLGEVLFIDVQDTVPQRSRLGGRLCVVLGFPASRNRGRYADRLQKNLRPTLRSYTAMSESLPKFAAKLGMNEADHVFMKHATHSNDPSGNRVSSFELPGMSGGAILDLGNVGLIEAISGRTPPRLAGIFLERYKENGFVVGIRVHGIVDAIRSVQ